MFVTAENRSRRCLGIQNLNPLCLTYSVLPAERNCLPSANFTRQIVLTFRQFTTRRLFALLRILIHSSIGLLGILLKYGGTGFRCPIWCCEFTQRDPTHTRSWFARAHRGSNSHVSAWLLRSNCRRLGRHTPIVGKLKMRNPEPPSNVVELESSMRSNICGNAG